MNLSLYSKRRLDSAIVGRAPLSVFFGLTTTVPILLLALIVGAFVAIFGAVDYSRASATGLLDGTLREMYAKNLAVIQNECSMSVPLDGTCFAHQRPSSESAVTNLRKLAAQGGLTECHPASMPAKSASEYDYLSCRGYQGPGSTLVIIWTSIAGVSMLCFLFNVLAFNVNRSLFPRFNPNLWLTPWTFLATATSIWPLTASFLIFNGRMGGEVSMPWDGLWKVLDGLLVLCVLVSCCMVGDLRTHPPERTYIIGLGVALGVAFVASLVLSLAYGAFSGGTLSLPPLLFAAFLGVCLFVACRWLGMQPESPNIAKATIGFLKRLAILSWPALLAGAILALDVSGFKLPWVNPVYVSASLCILALLSSRRFERTIM